MKNEKKNENYFLDDLESDISDIIDEKDDLINIPMRAHTSSSIRVDNYITITHLIQYQSHGNFANEFNNYANTVHSFLNKRRKMENRKRIQETNLAKRDFIKSLNVCEDVKRYIYSFL